MPKKAEKGYTMKRCRECGLPRIVSFFIRWGDNGTIVQLMSRHYRVVILHHGFIDNLLSSIEAKLGLSIEHIAFEAQRSASRDTFVAFIDKIPGMKFATRFKFARRMAVEMFHKVSVMTGMCRSWTVDYFPGDRGTAVIRNPFNIGLMAANVVGAFEMLEGLPFEQSWEEESRDTYIIKVNTAGVKSQTAERIQLKYAQLLPGSLDYNRCPRCKAPRSIAKMLKWIDSDGIIVDTRTGARVIFLDGYVVTAVFGEIAAELGDEVYDLVVEAQRDWTIDNVGELGLSSGNGPLSEEELIEAYETYLKMLPLYGYGNPVSFKMTDGAAQVVVENPYEPSILAGTLQGLYEALEKVKSEVSWHRFGESMAAFTVKPS
jgi:ribosomal protein S14